jgi:hypothetical protein
MRRDAQSSSMPNVRKSSLKSPSRGDYFYLPDRGGEHPERHLAGYAGILQPMRMRCSTRSTSRSESRVRSSKQHAGRMRGASSSSLPTSPRCWNARSMDLRHRSVLLHAAAASLRWSTISSTGGDRSGPSCRATTMDYMLRRIDAFTRFLDDGTAWRGRKLRGCNLGSTREVVLGLRCPHGHGLESQQRSIRGGL